MNLTKYNTLTFYARKISNHGGVFVHVDNERILSVDWGSFPSTWTKYTVDLSRYTGEHTLNIVGGWPDNTGYTSSQTQFCDIRLTNQ